MYKELNFLIMDGKDNLAICCFLRHFCNFKTFIEFFMFDEFVDGKWEDENNVGIICIVDSDLEHGDRIVLDTKNYELKQSKRRIKNIASADDCKRVIENVKHLILNRSEKIEALLKENNQN